MTTGQLLRLYPIPYRQLSSEQRFDRYDVIEALCWKSEDHRPESYKLDPESIRIDRRKDRIKPESTIRLWLPHVSSSLSTLREENETTGRSLGIIKPDPGSVRFIASKLSDAEVHEREVATSVYQQSLLFNDHATSPLPPPEFSFKYQFTSNGKPSEMKLHDWEVQAAFWNFKNQYGGSQGMEKLAYKYQKEIPEQGLHLVLGTVLAHPRQFITIGLLRSNKLEAVQAQGDLF